MTSSKKLSQVTDAEARKTVLIVASVLSLLAVWNLYRWRVPVVIVLGSLVSGLILIALFAPAISRRFHILWMGLAHILGYINSHILLTLVFYLLFVPYNLVARLVGRDPLTRRQAKRESYWVPRKSTRQSKEQFERLF